MATKINIWVQFRLIDINAGPRKGKQGVQNGNIVELLIGPTLDEELQVIALRIMGRF
jgi:hypothetical protein